MRGLNRLPIRSRIPASPSRRAFAPVITGEAPSARAASVSLRALPLALCVGNKGMAKTVWPDSEKKGHPHEKCWYQPADFPHEAALGYRWTLSQAISAALPPGDERYFRLGMDVRAAIQTPQQVGREEADGRRGRGETAIPPGECVGGRGRGRVGLEGARGDWGSPN